MRKRVIAAVALSLASIPSMLSAGTADYQLIYDQLQIQDSLPSQYDGRSYASLVKDQKSEGNCWNYVANALLETCLMKKYNITDPSAFNFSETAMDKDTAKEEAGSYGFERACGDEGYFDIALAYWNRSALNGPIDEGTGQKLPYYVRQTADLAIQKEATDLERQEYVKQIKELIYTYGAVTASYYCSSYYEGQHYYSCAPYDCEEDLAYYFPSNRDANHGSLIVGWDDQYSRENFNEALRPNRDGAFLVKNSWGSSWGNEGYFWVSYETALCDVNTIIKVETDDFYDTIYEYDKHGMIGKIGTLNDSNISAYMNTYDTKGAKEYLTALSTYITKAGNSYKLYVSEDGEIEHLKEVEAIHSGEYIEGKGYYQTYAGYITFELSEPIVVQDQFLVAIEVTSADDDQYTIPVETSNEDTCKRVDVVKDKGFISTSVEALKEGWRYDIGKKEANLCLKAFTKKCYE